MTQIVDIRTAINRLIEKKTPVVSQPCKVLVVDLDNATCDVEPLNGDADVLDVKLNAGTDINAGFTIIPPIDSIVYITYFSRNEAFVSLFLEVDRVILNNSSVSLELNSELLLNGNQFDGVVKVSDLVAKLNNLENDLNNVKNLIANWIPVPSDGGASLKVTLSPWFADTFVNTQKAELENTKVKHGGN